MRGDPACTACVTLSHFILSQRQKQKDTLWIIRYLSCPHILAQRNHHVFSSQTHEHMTISCIECIVKKYVSKAKIERPDLFPESQYSPHSCLLYTSPSPRD